MQLPLLVQRAEEESQVLLLLLLLLVQRQPEPRLSGRRWPSCCSSWGGSFPTGPATCSGRWRRCWA